MIRGEKGELEIIASNSILYCREFERCVEFYSTILEFEISMRNEWFVEFRISTDAFLSIADESRTSVSTSKGQGLTLTFRVVDADDVRVELCARGAHVTPISSRWGARCFYVFDPEGNRLEFWSCANE